MLDANAPSTIVLELSMRLYVERLARRDNIDIAAQAQDEAIQCCNAAMRFFEARQRWLDEAHQSTADM